MCTTHRSWPAALVGRNEWQVLQRYWYCLQEVGAFVRRLRCSDSPASYNVACVSRPLPWWCQECIIRQCPPQTCIHSLECSCTKFTLCAFLTLLILLVDCLDLQYSHPLLAPNLTFMMSVVLVYIQAGVRAWQACTSFAYFHWRAFALNVHDMCSLLS